MSESFSSRFYHFLEAYPHPFRAELTGVLTAKTSLSTSGFPYISQSSFNMFLQGIPHLFQEGNQLLSWLTALQTAIQDAPPFSQKERSSLKKSIAVLKNIVQTAGICAPPDHWILRHVLSNHAKVGLLTMFQDGSFLDKQELSENFGFDSRHLGWDLAFLHCRGYLRCRGSRYALTQHFQAVDLFQRTAPLRDEFICDMVEPITNVLSKRASDQELHLVQSFYEYGGSEHQPRSWQADAFQVGIGYRLVPTVLALHSLQMSTNELEGKMNHFSAIGRLLVDAGMIQEGHLTPLGTRILQRGPGPFGIIHAYVPYMRELKNKIRGKAIHTHVQRGKNIAASQSANRKTFAMGNDSLDQFCRDQNFHFHVFIEHALGQGEATRQRLEHNGEATIQYFGADLEDAAIDAAEKFQKEGVLPKNMIFIRRADIANPEAVIAAVRKTGSQTEDAVMFVGNGFHEIRSQTNESIISVFRKYCEAGVLLIFTEESALGDRDLLNTGWNTYHAGFRYVHELSGQGLRPASGVDREGRYSWKICASLGGYAVLPKYSVHTRTIYPFPRKGGHNPPISMTYFCVPQSLARKLGFYPTSWTQSQ
jgi:hypothetical protein